MKKVIIIILIIFLIPIVYAETIDNYNDYTYLNINFNLDGSFKLIKEGNNPKITELSTNLTFFPRQEINQDVLSITLKSNPEAKTNFNIDNVGYNWFNPNLGDYTFGLESETQVRNAIVPINNKIRFPIENVDTYYTKPTEFIDLNDDIKNQALELAQGENDLYQVTFDIAKWVENNIQYNLSTLTSNAVQKSSWVLKNKEGVCDELTNLFISMVRSLGIPARFVSGMAYTNLNHEFGPHAWAEVYFPDKGWVPFDITYGQFGWIDPTHVKLKTNIDSGDASIRYTWKAYNVKFDTTKVNPKANIIKLGNKIAPPSELKVKSLISNVGPGSYVPFEVEITNNNNFYIPETLFVTKSFKLTERNIKSKLLKPAETKKIYWITQIPEELQSGYTYYGEIAVKDEFNTEATTNITYTSDSRVISLKEAQDIIFNKLETEETKVYSPDIKLKCSTKEKYLSYEKPFVNCEVKNKGNTLLRNIKTCILEDCQTINQLGISEIKYINFNLNNLQNGFNNIIIKSNSNNIETTDIVQTTLLNSPELNISEIDYKKIVKYDENVDIKITLISKIPVKDVILIIKGNNEVNVGKFDNSKNLLIEAKGKDFNEDNINIKINYKDINDREYSFERNYQIYINDIPWYIKFLRWIRIL